MSNKITNNLFLDLDECLIQSLWVRGEEQLNNFKDWYGCFDHIDFYCGGNPHERYITFLRPLAYELIDECKKLVGDENVYILTAATLDYANYINANHRLGIDRNRVYAREDWSSGWKVEKFENSNNILIDNEDFWYHSMGRCNKRSFLNLKEENLIQIKEFDVMVKEDFTPEKEEEELHRLVEELKTRLV